MEYWKSRGQAGCEATARVTFDGLELLNLGLGGSTDVVILDFDIVLRKKILNGRVMVKLVS